jgi:hypothetical protein
MSADRHARTMLPIPDRPAFGLTTYDAKDPDTSYPPIEPLVPPESAPNVLLILLDDVGFGAAGTFGGPCRTPTADRLAAGGLRYNRFHSVKNKSFSVTAEVVVPEGGVEGVIIAQGGRFGGWAVYTKKGKAKFVYNVLGIQEFAIEASTKLSAGTHQIRMEFANDGGGLAKGGDVTLYYDGTDVGAGRVGATQPLIFSADETTDIGYESGTTVTSDYTARDSRFTGKINWVQLDLGKDDHDHFIDPEERLRVAMSRQ